MSLLPGYFMRHAGQHLRCSLLSLGQHLFQHFSPKDIPLAAKMAIHHCFPFGDERYQVVSFQHAQGLG